MLFGLTVKHKATAILLSYLALGLSMPSCVTSSAGAGGGGTAGAGTGSSTGTSNGAGTGTGLCSSDSCPHGQYCATVSAGEPYGECTTLQCVPCDSSSGPVCDAKGHVYASQCAAIDAGQSVFGACIPPGMIGCPGSPLGPPLLCDAATEDCVPGFLTDCGGSGPAQCVPKGVDGGTPDSGDGDPDGGAGGPDGGDGG